MCIKTKRNQISLFFVQKVPFHPSEPVVANVFTLSRCGSILWLQGSNISNDDVTRELKKLLIALASGISDASLRVGHRVRWETSKHAACIYTP